MSLAVVISIGVVAALLFFLFNSLKDSDNKTNYALQVIILGFLLWTIILLGKAAIDYQENCEIVVKNETIKYSYNASNLLMNETITRDYDYQCSNLQKTTSFSFYKATLWLARLITLYIFFSFAFELIMYFGWVKRGGKQE